MVRKFSERFKELVNENVPRSFMRLHGGDRYEVDEEDYGIIPAADFSRPENGFIATYCEEK